MKLLRKTAGTPKSGLFWGGLAPRDQLIFTSDFNKYFDPYPQTVNYAMYSELARIMLILLSIIFNWCKDDPAKMQLFNAAAIP